MWKYAGHFLKLFHREVYQRFRVYAKINVYTCIVL